MSHVNLSEDDHSGLTRVLDRASSDAGYRQQLLTDPHAAIAAVTGTPVQPSLRIRFIEKDSSLDALVVLPDVVDEHAELTESELAAVAGGAQEEEEICWDTCSTTCEKTCAITGIGVLQ